MAALKDLKQSLDNAQRDLDEVVADFNKVIELRTSLQAADTSLKASSETVAAMAASLKQSGLGLGECISSLQTAANVIGSIDPNEIRENQANVEHGMSNLELAIERIGTKLEKKIDDVEHAALQMDERIKLITSRERLVLLLLSLVLVLAAVGLFLAYGPRDFADNAILPTHELALRGALYDGMVVHSASAANWPISEFCAGFGVDERIKPQNCTAYVQVAQRGYGVRRKQAGS